MDTLLEELWPLVLEHVFAPSTIRLRVSALQLTHVCKDWRARIVTHVHKSFKALRTYAMALDNELRMRALAPMMNLRVWMGAYCYGLGLRAWEILCLLAPSWGTEDLKPALTARGVETPCSMIAQREGKWIRVWPWYFRRYLISLDIEHLDLLAGPWLFGGQWNRYLLLLFLSSDAAFYDASLWSYASADHFVQWWGTGKKLRYLPAAYFDRGSCDIFRHITAILARQGRLSEPGHWYAYPNIHTFAGTFQKPYDAAILATIPPWESDEHVSLDFICPDWETCTPTRASGLYYILTTYAPHLWTEEVKKKVLARMRGESVSLLCQ
jgi:hypothetical protein